VLPNLASRAYDREKYIDRQAVDRIKAHCVATEQHGPTDIRQLGELAEGVRDRHAPSDASRELLLPFEQQALDLNRVERRLAGLRHDTVA
jgi:hypothetical protein